MELPKQPTPQQTLTNYRKQHDLTLEALADLLDTSKQRLYQYGAGDPIPFDRIKEWATNPAYDPKVKELAYQLWIAHLYQEINGLVVSVGDLKSLVAA